MKTVRGRLKAHCHAFRRPEIFAGWPVMISDLFPRFADTDNKKAV
ncbi:hypothetical protein HMPREF9123_2494 [Neisseria bacilliformis ATCC BAA-1200]|uniref:Uncharacterized protein n=1 Tax=Neisseria bacilliformis ATCC BAA-1200 TaxID=888742 RepID=F2BFI7_9NEIS|nr:hypothetical protein HMPREF9123_2494 [Neisseria bacilliformis ATCC BAA-1200]